MPKKYIPFKQDEILEIRKNSIIVQNSATRDLSRVEGETYGGIDYLLTSIAGGSVVYSLGGTLKKFMRDERVYRIAETDCMDGLGTRLVPVKNSRRIKRILEKKKKNLEQQL